MCEYVYSSGKKCRRKPLKGSKYCSLHIPFEEGELLYGDKIREIKRRAFERALERGVRTFEGVQLYDVIILEKKIDHPVIFRNSKIKRIIIGKSELASLTIINSEVDSIAIIDSTVDFLYLNGLSGYGVSICSTKFSSSILVRNSNVRYVMINSTEYYPKEVTAEEEFGEAGRMAGRIELSNLSGVRRIALNSRYPLIERLRQELGIEFESKKRPVKAHILHIANISFDESPRFKRQVRIFVNGFAGQLLIENSQVPGHVEIVNSKVRYPEFVHVTILNNLVLRNSKFYSDENWNLTYLPNLLAELSVFGFIVIENCTFNNPYLAEVFYRIARTTWEGSGDKEKADEYYYLEMLARRKRVLAHYRKGPKTIKKALRLLEVIFEFLFADLTCKYGTDWRRPVFLWLALVIFGFPIAYALTGSVIPVNSPFDYVYFSIVTATTLGYGDLHPVGVGKVIASIEAIFGMFMWAVFLTVFARKYMR
ncbi:potassium channel family protein [Pyrococcus sp. ST04]|uniref:potassium channel family protein n=1 Tax=Pyrococcus sp. ST04 TaxID=1183377 RepID=UPI0002605DCF|nr:potassium channel family protein [Pyrococcus sp. ST04]AFK23134.1 putative Kef-type K+ transport systems NAD-binding subunit [Pyrococcus sp. ST04]